MTGPWKSKGCEKVQNFPVLVNDTKSYTIPNKSNVMQ